MLTVPVSLAELAGVLGSGATPTDVAGDDTAAALPGVDPVGCRLGALLDEHATSSRSNPAMEIVLSPVLRMFPPPLGHRIPAAHDLFGQPTLGRMHPLP